MENEILFTEQQRFKQWWIWLILLALNGALIFGVFKQVVGNQQFGNKSDNGLLVGMGLTLLFSFLFLNLRLETIIKRDGIYVRFFPFHLKFKRYTWDTLTKSYVRQYSPLTEYGGWGLRFGLFGSGRAFNVSGDQGLQLQFSDDRKLLIGTRRPEELAAALREIGALKD